MTPKRIITADFLEIAKVEITCPCGASLAFPVPREKGQEYPPRTYVCPACHKTLWDKDELHNRVYSLVRDLAQWQSIEGKKFSLSFSLDEISN